MSPYRFKELLQKVTMQKLGLLVKRFVIVCVSLLLSFLLLNLVFPLPDSIGYTKLVTDNKGQIIHAWLTPDEKWRLKTDLDEISPLLRKTIVAKEDKYFYSHPGINPFAIARAAFNNLFSAKRTSGASTISMQVARALEKRERTLWSKIAESFRALQLEWKYDKDEILQLYLNLAPYGGNIEGVKAASLLYFQKSPDHLSLAEITALSIIPNRPSSLVPGKNNELIVQERNKWLHRFAKEKVFTEKEISDALQEPLTVQRNPFPRLAPHISYQLRKRNELEIQSSIDINTQLKIEKLTEDHVRTLRLKNIRNAAVVVVDNRSGKVIAYLGSASFTDTTDGGQVNGAAAIRQPGSTLKPLLYGLCFDEGLLTPKQTLDDVPVNFQGYAPENYDRQFKGAVTVEHALEHSLNIPAVKGLHLLGKDKMIHTLVQADFRQVARDRDKLGLSLVLGGCGASLEELTGLFAAFANQGIYRPLSFTVNDTVSNKKRILSEEASFMITDILSQVNRPDFPLNWQATERMPRIAWKTGTSYGRKDAWSIGYNKAYTVGVWVGNFSAEGAPDLSGTNTATPLLFKIFNTIDYNNDNDWFQPPSGVDIRQVCSETGLPPGVHCANRIIDRFIPLVSSSATCAHMQEIKVSPSLDRSYCHMCAPEAGYIKKLYKVLAPAMALYYEERNTAFERIPPHNPACEKIFHDNGPNITSPSNGAEYFISKKEPEPVLLQASTGNDVTRLYWYINDKFYKSTARGERQFFLPAEGPVKISCTDDKGRNRNVRILVSYIDL